MPVLASSACLIDHGDQLQINAPEIRAVRSQCIAIQSVGIDVPILCGADEGRHKQHNSQFVCHGPAFKPGPPGIPAMDAPVI
jgi:hypothetical protein